MIKNINEGAGGNQQPQIDMSKTTPIICEKCEGKTFKQTLMLRKLSRIVSPNGQDTIVPVAVFACEGCGHIPQDMIDDEFEI